MREDHQNERPLILPLSLQRKVLGENTPPQSDTNRSLNEGQPKLEIIRGVQICTRDVPGFKTATRAAMARIRSGAHYKPILYKAQPS